MSFIASFSMYFLSFLPLWISVIFIDGKSIWDGSPHVCTEIISIALILIISVLSVISVLASYCGKHQNGAQQYTLVSAKEEKNNHI